MLTKRKNSVVAKILSLMIFIIAISLYCFDNNSNLLMVLFLGVIFLQGMSMMMENQEAIIEKLESINSKMS